MDLICPICGSKLNTFGKSLVCAGHHCFDIARQGYVNLLTVQQKHSLHPGDTREQVLSRRSFLEAGYYAPIAEALVVTSKEVMATSKELDVISNELTSSLNSKEVKAISNELTSVPNSKEVRTISNELTSVPNSKEVSITSKELTVTSNEVRFSGELLDVGCGEGYYSARLAEALGFHLTGMDISREAVRCAAGKYKNGLWLCATASHIPVADHSCRLLTSLFALTMPEEFRRVLRPDGYFLQVLAAEDHLLGLKSIIYDQLIEKPKDTVPDVPGFTLVKSVPIRFTFTVEGEQVENLLSMTPHVFRIGKDGARRLRETKSLTDTASCVLNVFRPQ